MYKLQLHVHPSIRPDEVLNELEGNFEGLSIMEGIIKIVSDYPNLESILLNGNKLKPGLLVFAEKVELTSLDMLKSPLEENLRLRVVPILHGG